jgi:hypothetical protein
MKNRRKKWIFMFRSPTRGNGLQDDHIVNVAIMGTL